MDERDKPTLYIVVPCYNEDAILTKTIASLREKLNECVQNQEITNESKILFVDDGSRDATWEIIRKAGKEMPCLQGISFSRNEGHQNAIWAGMNYAWRQNADAVITIDADLQQDVNAIHAFVEKYRNGADVVFGIRNSRSTDGFLKKLSADAFYRLMDFLGTKTIKNHADYRLLSRKALDALFEYTETQLFLRGTVSELGFARDYVYFNVKEREAGESKYTLRKMLTLAFNGITSFSIKPVHIIFGLGVVVSFIGFIMIIYNVITWAIGITVPGWASTLSSIWFLGGLNFLFLGVIGEYIGKNYMESKKRPLYFVKEKVNIDG